MVVKVALQSELVMKSENADLSLGISESLQLKIVVLEGLLFEVMMMAVSVKAFGDGTSVEDVESSSIACFDSVGTISSNCSLGGGGIESDGTGVDAWWV